MPARDLGSKWTCFKCGSKFYDLKKAEPICPKCGANVAESPSLKAGPADKKRGLAREEVETPAVEAADEAPDDDAEAEEEVPPAEEESAEEEDLDA